jgi:hypothetical protein
MLNYDTSLTIDFGEVGGWREKHPFRRRLETGLHSDLIRAAKNVHLVYELLLVDRLGDILEYVWVVLEDVPKRILDSIARTCQALSIARTTCRESPPQSRRGHSRLLRKTRRTPSVILT